MMWPPGRMRWPAVFTIGHGAPSRVIARDGVPGNLRGREQLKRLWLATKKRWRVFAMRDWAWIIRRAMPFIDALLIVVAFLFAYILRYNLQCLKGVEAGNDAPFEPYLPYALIYALWLLGTWPVAGLYRDQRSRSWFEEVYTLINGATNATVLVMALSFLLRPEVFSRLLIIEATVLAVILLSFLGRIYPIVPQIPREPPLAASRVFFSLARV